MDVTICDVGPRDGLQNEPDTLPPPKRAELVTRLAAAGVPRIEAVSFVRDDRVPQMAGAEEVVAASRRGSAHLSGLVLNERGYERFARTALDRVNCTLAATETFNQRNGNATLDDAVRRVEAIVAAANRPVTVTVSCSFGCPFEGEVDPARVADFARRCADSGVQELCLADTVGVGAPGQVTDLTARMRDVVGELPLRFHFHNTRNTGFANAYAAVAEGVDVLDASAGGIGGCPFAPKATGNIATDDLVYMLERMGHRTGIDLSTLLPTAAFLGEQLGHEVPALLPRAGAFP